MSMNYGDSETTNCSQGRDGDTGAIELAKGMSPYATGGGGVTFERKVAVLYLAHLLVGDGAVEFGEGRHAVSVAFQQAPSYPVDDLVVTAAHPDEFEPSMELALAVRRSPNLVSSDQSTQGLIRQFVRATIDVSPDGIERRWGLVVAGPQPHAERLQTLASLAADQMDASGFFKLVRTPNKFSTDVQGRFYHVEKLVEFALKELGDSELDVRLVQERTWQLLSGLVVLMPRLESPDESDWSAVENSLIPVSRTSDLTGASRLRDRLVAMAGEYSPKAAQVDLTLLRRDTYGMLDGSNRRHHKGWRALDHLHEAALTSVRNEIATIDGDRRVSLDRSDAVKELVATAEDAEAVLVSGDSGVGKSALTLLSLTSAAEVDPETTQTLCINLRHIPKETVTFESILNRPLTALLCELSAPRRMLIIDGADAATEGKEDAFRYLIDAVVESEVKVVTISSLDSMQVVRDVLSDRFGASVAEYRVKPLTDAELNELVAAFPELGRLNTNPRSRDLLRRLVVVDLLVRGRLTGVPLSDADAMREVWSGLVRRRERSDRGHPDAREAVILQLAALALSGGDRPRVISGLDATALAGLRHDGLLQASDDNPYMIGPDFAHDEVRRYAVARLLLAEKDPTSRILDASAPRWALGAARLACQALLEEPDSASAPLRGRFASLQESFDALVAAGHGTRWGDVPSESLVTLADPSAVLRDAWPKLPVSDATGLRRLARVVDQRLRDENGIVNLNAIEPIVELLLEDSAPWQSGKYASDLLREWLHGHAFSRTPPGHPLRTLFRERLVEAYTEGDRRLIEQREDEVAARADRTPEDIERERQFLENHPWLLSEVGSGDQLRRERPEVPRECRDEVFLELLALLGPDLGEDGATILRRVAQDAPWLLAPALEEQLTGFALAEYGCGLLAHLTEAYYLDDEADGYETFDNDGVRPHFSRSVGIFLPPAAWNYGPFMSLFQTDFRAGVAVLNRLLNHAALIRAHKLVPLDGMRHGLEDTDFGQYRTGLNISGTRRLYVGDQHVWRLYRGTGVGPYPCISALLALEMLCDQLIRAGIPISDLVPILLEGCENLAMVGLIVGVLVRHLEDAGDLLDPYLTEPLIWDCEFARLVSENSNLAASSEGIEKPQRRGWSLQEAAATMAWRAGDKRIEELRTLGATLVERAHSIIVQDRAAAVNEEQANGDVDAELFLAKVRNWASGLDRSNYQIRETPDGPYIQATTPEDVANVLNSRSEDLERTAEEIRLAGRYFLHLTEEDAELIDAEELTADLASVGKLHENQPSLSVYGSHEVPAVIASAAINAYVLRHADIPDDGMAFAIETVLGIAEGDGPQPRLYEYEDTYYEQGADRSVARAIPILLLPAAANLRGIVDGASTFNRVSAAGIKIAQAIANEVRLHLARGLDHLWATPCVQDGPCHHQVGWHIATATVRDCAVGDWNPDTGRHSITVLAEPLTKSLATTPDGSIRPGRLDASIRALAPVATASICVSTSAQELLTALLSSQRRSLLTGKRDGMDPRGTHSLVTARALLTLAQHGDDTAVYEYIDAYADNPALLRTLLRALSAAAEETSERAATARRIWPSVVHHVLNLHNRGVLRFQRDSDGEKVLAALLPNYCYEYQYLYREVQEQPIVWWEPLELRPEVEAWLGPAVGKAECVDQLIIFLKTLDPEDQAHVGIPWVATLVIPSPGHIARESFMLAEWLIEMRSTAESADLSARWQEIVDALVVEGVWRLAPYSV